jgi:hypothetical protein
MAPNVQHVLFAQSCHTESKGKISIKGNWQKEAQVRKKSLEILRDRLA